MLLDIRTKAGGRLIEARADQLWAIPQVACDVKRFEMLMDQGALADAAALARHDFATIQAIEFADGFSDWRAAVNADLRRRLRGRASAKWSRGCECADWASALDAAEALYVLDPRDAQGVERVIDARGRVGEVERAEQAFAEYLESLDLTTPPLEGIQEAIRRVRHVAQSSRLMRPEPVVPLIGRHDALDESRSLFTQMDSGHFGFVLVCGESGIGKTRLLQELQREALFRGLRCLWAQAVEVEAQIPLNPLLDLLRGVDLGPHLAALGRPWSAVIGAVLPPGTVAEPLGELPPIKDRAVPRRLLDALSLLLQSLAREKPTVLFIDDLQWSDATTITALQFVQRRWSSGPLGVMATIRPELVRPDNPVAKYFSTSDGLTIRRVELHELAPAEALQLVDQIGGGRIGEYARRRICALAGPHPLYLTELARDYLSGRLTLPQTPADELTIPVSLEQIFAARLRHLDGRSVKVAGILAVGARPMQLTTVAALAGLGLDDTADAIDDLRRARLVASQGDRVSIAHELFRSAIYRHLGEPRRALNHRMLAAHMLSVGADDSPGELAIHYARAGECNAAARYGWVAADRAMETGTVAEAAHFYQLVAENEQDPTRRAEATAGLARALHLARDITRASPLLEVAANQLSSVGKAAEALRLQIKRIEGLADVGAVPLAVLSDDLDRLKQRASLDADWEAVALALDVELHLLHRAGDVSGIRRVFAEMREVGGQGSESAAVLTHAGLALGVLFGDPEEALASAQQAVALATNVRCYRLMALTRLMVVLQYKGMLELPSSRAMVQEARALAERSGDLLLHFSIESNLAVAALDAGDLDRADVLLTLASRIPGAADMDFNRSIQANNRAELALAQRDFRSAAGCFGDALSFFGPTTPSYLRHLVSAGQGLCALETGDLAGARRLESELSDTPSTWTFDPTTILAFRTLMHDRRGQYREGIGLLESAAQDLEDRLVLAWLKVRALQVRLMAKRRVSGARQVANEARRRAKDLCLYHRADQFTQLLATL